MEVEESNIAALLAFPRKKAAIVIGTLITLNAIVWLVSGLIYARLVPQGVALLIVSYALGLRHALDADHIAAIDNVTRRLVQNGQKPVTVGLFFSLGHSTIVIIATMLVAALSTTIKSKFDRYSNVSSVIGPSISSGFLFLIGTINGVSAYLIVKDFKNIKNLKSGDKVDWEEILSNSGFFSRVFGKHLFRVIDAPYKMYFVGFLFGLGFDTATEVALLGIAALQALNGADVWLILFLPILFTCGMTLIDTTDGVLMLGAYGWASITPSRKLYYNLSITTISCIFALFIASLQLLSIFQSEFDLNGIFWDFISSATDSNNFGVIGIVLLSSFIAGWLLSRILYYNYAPLETEKEKEVEIVLNDSTCTEPRTSCDNDSESDSVSISLSHLSGKSISILSEEHFSGQLNIDIDTDIHINIDLEGNITHQSTGDCGCISVSGSSSDGHIVDNSNTYPSPIALVYSSCDHVILDKTVIVCND